LVKSAVVQIDATPFRQWWETHYGEALGKRKSKNAAATSEDGTAKKSNHVMRKLEDRKTLAKIDQQIDDQFSTGRLYAVISSRPGQSGRCDGYILEGKELEFYLKKIKHHKK